MSEEKSLVEVTTGQLSPTELNEKVDSYLMNLGVNLPRHLMEQFKVTAMVYNLNPMTREIYGVPYMKWNAITQKKEPTLSIIVGYEVYLKRAERSGKLVGWKAWTEGTGPDAKACVEIHRKDWEKPFYHEVYLSEYAQDNAMWKGKPRTMIKKVGIAQAFRMAFPEDLGGIPYSSEELPDNMNGLNREVIPDMPKLPQSSEVKEPKQEPKKEEVLNVEKPVVPASEETKPELPPKEDRKLFNGTVEEAINEINTKIELCNINHENFVGFCINKKLLVAGGSLNDITLNKALKILNNWMDIVELFEEWEDHVK